MLRVHGVSFRDTTESPEIRTVERPSGSVDLPQTWIVGNIRQAGIGNSPIYEKFRTCIVHNGLLIPHYDERYHNGETLATGFVESMANQVVS
jgi:hypothetical protein